jgi:hypothetical protein
MHQAADAMICPPCKSFIKIAGIAKTTMRTGIAHVKY